jgi:beta-lactamase regulating signal transducer with metallopeptidase domain
MTGLAAVAAASAFDALVLVALTLIAVRLLRRRPAALRHAIVAAGLTAAAAAPLFEAAGPRWELPVLASADVTTTGLTLTSDAPAGAAWIESDSAPASPAIGWTELVMMAWGAGAIVLLSSLLIGVTRLVRLTRRCRPLASEAWREEAAVLAAQCGLTRPIELLESQHAAMLVTWGILRPRIIVPSGAANWPVERVHVVLAHELAHVARGDWALQIAAEFVCAAYWFNPLVWIACRRLRDESELACDDAVLTRGVAAADYATHLLDIARQAVGSGRAWATAAAVANPSTLERRIAAMLNASRNRAPLRRGSGVIALIAMLAVAAPMTALTLTGRVDSSPSTTTTGDVALIATPEPAAVPQVAPVRRAPRPAATAAAAAAPAPAQQAPASVSGTMADASGAVLPGVEVALTDRTSGVRMSRVTDVTGQFRFADLAPGQYNLTATLPGFAPVLSEITLAPGQNFERRIGMRVGAVQESLKVTCASGAAALAPDVRLFAFVRPSPAPRLFLMPAAAQTQPVRVGGQIKAPQQIKSVSPMCPGGAELESGGTVIILEATIGTDGSVKDVRSLRPAQGDARWPDLVDAARVAVQQWRYTPTLLNNTPVPVIMTVTVLFSRT